MASKRDPQPDMAKKPAAAQPTSAAKRLAQQRAEAARQRLDAAQRRRRLLAFGVPLLVVVLAVAVLVIVKVATGAGSPKSGAKASRAGSGVTQQLAVPAAVLDKIGVGDAVNGLKPVNAPALTSEGKPLFLYIGAEYCPYCAAERWAAVVALTRFGTFSGLGQTTSSPSDVFPSTPTLTFHGATYTSRYLAFTGKELQTNQVVNGRYTPLDTMTAEEQKLLDTYDRPPYSSSAGGIPFIDIAGRHLIAGATYDPGVLHGKTHAQIVAALSDPKSPIARAVNGSANLITAAICEATNQQPTNVCASPGVRTAATALGSAR